MKAIASSNLSVCKLTSVAGGYSAAPIGALFVVLWTLFAIPASAQDTWFFDDFVTDQGAWEEYDPLGIGSVTTADGVCNLSSPPSPMPSVSPAIVGLNRMDLGWMDFEVGVDISGWQVGDNINNYFIILARASANADGTLNGIGLAFVPNATPELDPHGYIPHPLLGFDVIENSQPVGSGRAVVDLSSLSLDPARNYRLVFRGEGTAVQGELYEIGAGHQLIAETSTSLTEVMVPGGITIVAVDRAGVAGIANNGVSVTLDNVYATEGQAQPDLQIDPAVILTWPVWTAGFVLESAGRAEGPWQPVNAEPELTSNGNVVSVRTDNETRYFRLVRP